MKRNLSPVLFQSSFFLQTNHSMTKGRGKCPRSSFLFMTIREKVSREEKRRRRRSKSQYKQRSHQERGRLSSAPFSRAALETFYSARLASNYKYLCACSRGDHTFPSLAYILLIFSFLFLNEKEWQKKKKKKKRRRGLVRTERQMGAK